MTNDELMTKPELRTSFLGYLSLGFRHSFFPLLQIFEKIRCSSRASKACERQGSTPEPPEPPSVQSAWFHVPLFCRSQCFSKTLSLRRRHQLRRSLPRLSFLGQPVGRRCDSSPGLAESLLRNQ